MKTSPKNIHHVWFPVLIGLVWMFVGSVQAQAATGVAGQVTDFSTGSVIANTAISTIGNATTHTGADGSYSLELQSGVYDITFTKTGYQDVTIDNVLVFPNAMTELNVNLTTPGPLNITTTNLPATDVDTPYNASIRLSGWVWPYSFSIANGSLPSGLFIDSQYGNIQGSSTQAGFHIFTVGVSDAIDSYAEREFVIEVSAAGLTVTTTSPLLRGVRAIAYSTNLEASGGTVPYEFSRTDGTLPPGISLSSEGHLSGTPTDIGPYQFTIQITDASSQTISATFHLTIDSPLEVATITLNDGIVGSPYNQSLFANGGQGGYTWNVYSGVLPEGLSFDGSSGVLSGTPTEATYGTVMFSVLDNEGQIANKDFTLQVVKPLEILTSTLPVSLVNKTFSEAIRIQGGVEPYTFSYTGQLSTGLILDENLGIISGIPEITGLVNVSVIVADSTYPITQSVTRNLSIRTTDQLNDPLLSPTCNLDIDGNGTADALTDGVLTIRHLLGFSGDSLTNGAFGTGAVRTSAQEVTEYLSSTLCIAMLDVDGNTQREADTDGFLIMRFLAGLTGEALANGVIGSGAIRLNPADVEAWLVSFMPGSNSSTFVIEEKFLAFKGKETTHRINPPFTLVDPEAPLNYSVVLGPETLMVDQNGMLSAQFSAVAETGSRDFAIRIVNETTGEDLFLSGTLYVMATEILAEQEIGTAAPV